jgi:hypothetical protein
MTPFPKHPKPVFVLVWALGGGGGGLWLIARPFICSFYIAHSTFTSMLHFCFNLIQPLAYNFFTCECGHRLDTFGMHLVGCLFGGQRIITHDANQDAIYALIRENGHVVWREHWYAFTLQISLQDLYMT